MQWSSQPASFLLTQEPRCEVTQPKPCTASRTSRFTKQEVVFLNWSRGPLWDRNDPN